MPRPVGYLGQLHLTLQEYAPGQPLYKSINSPNLVGLVRGAARNIAAIHGSDIPLGRQRGAGRNSFLLDRRIKVVSALRPDLVSG